MDCIRSLGNSLNVDWIFFRLTGRWLQRIRDSFVERFVFTWLVYHCLINGVLFLKELNLNLIEFAIWTRYINRTYSCFCIRTYIVTVSGGNDAAPIARVPTYCTAHLAGQRIDAASHSTSIEPCKYGNMDMHEHWHRSLLLTDTWFIKKQLGVALLVTTWTTKCDEYFFQNIDIP